MLTIRQQEIYDKIKDTSNNEYDSSDILNGLIAPILKESYGWDRENIKDVKTLNATTLLLLDNSKAIIQLISVDQEEDLNIQLEAIDNIIEHKVRYYLVIQRTKTKLYDALHKVYKENIDFYDSTSMAFLNKENISNIDVILDRDFISKNIKEIFTLESLVDYFSIKSIPVSRESIVRFVNDHLFFINEKVESIIDKSFIKLNRSHIESDIFKDVKCTYILASETHIIYNSNAPLGFIDLLIDLENYLSNGLFLTNEERKSIFTLDSHKKEYYILDENNNLKYNRSKNGIQKLSNTLKIEIILKALDYISVSKQRDFSIYLKIEDNRKVNKE